MKLKIFTLCLDPVTGMRNQGLVCLFSIVFALGCKSETSAPEATRVEPVAETPAPVEGEGAAGDEGKRGASGKAEIEWVTIEGGSFMMGSERGESEEQPRHRVTVRTFQVAKTEVTNGQYRSCVAAGACTPTHDTDGTCYVFDGMSWGDGVLPASMRGDEQPAVCVDWEQARAFSEWAGGRLPSEAEWEYAARSAGKEWEYPWGDEAATCARAVMDEGGSGCGRGFTWPVCSKSAGNTRQGLCDMAGNVWEWTQDWYHDSYNGAPTDGKAWESLAGSVRVTRGGSGHSAAGYARSAYRNGGGPGYRGGDLGFRPAR